jgi:hypothetical protein
MKFQTTAPERESRALEKMGQALLKEFQNLKSKSQYITKLKEIKKI